ncbi:hypothetical protein [uncultured Rubinisphaera sp.]|uniref:hypothetical protein n=1 Tax=uncultured Rubinisphaera sp. TaxID=1678686 RepID=UPI0030D9C92D
MPFSSDRLKILKPPWLHATVAYSILLRLISDVQEQAIFKAFEMSCTILPTT